jgi:hypothetical protein
MSPGDVPITPFDGWWKTQMLISPVIALGKSWTLSCWHKMGGTITGHPPDFVITDANTGNGMRAAYGGKMVFGDGVTASNTNISAGWHMLTMTYDGMTLRYYLDGAADGTTAQTLNNLNISRIFSSNFDRGLKSYAIDEVGIWSRPLSAAEIAQLYNGGAGKFYPF